MYSQSVDGHLLAPETCSEPEPEPDALLEKWKFSPFRDFFFSALFTAASRPRVRTTSFSLSLSRHTS